MRTIAIDPIAPGCVDANFHADGSVNLVDFGVCEGCMSGAHTSYASGCYR